jgi:hypothetical protein
VRLILDEIVSNQIPKINGLKEHVFPLGHFNKEEIIVR